MRPPSVARLWRRLRTQPQWAVLIVLCGLMGFQYYHLIALSATNEVLESRIYEAGHRLRRD